MQPLTTTDIRALYWDYREFRGNREKSGKLKTVRERARVMAERLEEGKGKSGEELGKFLAVMVLFAIRGAFWEK